MPLMKHSVYVDVAAYRLLVALFLSLLLHMALLTKLGPSSQNRGTGDLPLQIRLITPAPPAEKIIEPAKSEPQKLVAPLQEILPSKKLGSTPAPPDPVIRKELTAPEPVVTAPTPQIEESPRLVDQQPEIPVPDQNAPANWAEIEFDIFSGEVRKPISTGQLHYESSNENYQLIFKEKSPPEGLSPNEAWNLEILGRITRRGLSPSSYQLQGELPRQLLALENTASETSTENSDSADSVLRNHPQSGRMPDGILDHQSLLFQFMFFPPIDEEGQLILTNGKRIDAYIYRIGEMEAVEVGPQGAMQTLHVILSAKESEDMIELWLAPDFRYLPVKVRLTKPDGYIIEQQATSINFR